MSDWNGNEAKLNAIYERNKMELFEIYQAYDAEWKERWRKHKEEGGPLPTIEDRYILALGQCDHLIEQIKQQKRLIEFTATGKTEPQTHFAQAVVVGVLGAG